MSMRAMGTDTYNLFHQLQNWMNVIAYCLGYGTILAKMGRVYKIFHNPAPMKKQMVSLTHGILMCMYKMYENIHL